MGLHEAPQLDRAGDPFHSDIKGRLAVGYALRHYLLVLDPKLNGAYKVRERRAEFEALLSAVLNMQAQEEKVA